MHILIATREDGTTYHLTTEPLASHQGPPVLRITGGLAIAGDWKAKDQLWDPLDVEPFLLPAKLVVAWAKLPGRSPNEIDAARAFLATWPEGPQI